ncbi:zinc ribbon domain-containing protein [Arabiibacter massiliensis]
MIMPFVACPDCNNVVSDAAHKCPHCGKDLDQMCSLRAS